MISSQKLRKLRGGTILLFLRSLLAPILQVSACFVAICVIWFWLQSLASTKPRFTVPRQPVSLEDAELKGSQTARVALIEFSDFQCPFCGQFARETLPRLVSDYAADGRLLIAFRHLPLSKIHTSALTAAVAADCAGSQGEFWQMHDLLFRVPQDLSEKAILDNAKSLGLNLARFVSCAREPTSTAIELSKAAAKEMDIDSTPSFLIGDLLHDGRVQVRKRISGTPTLEGFRGLIDAALSTSLQKDE